MNKKKIKIIDILCYISTGDYDKLPEEFKYAGYCWRWCIACNIYETKDKDLKEMNLYKYFATEGDLNDEVEILDEEDEFTDIVEWGEPALEEVKTKTDYTIKDLQRYIYILMQTQNDLTKNQKKIIERLKDE